MAAKSNKHKRARDVAVQRGRRHGSALKEMRWLEEGREEGLPQACARTQRVPTGGSEVFAERVVCGLRSRYLVKAENRELLRGGIAAVGMTWVVVEGSSLSLLVRVDCCSLIADGARRAPGGCVLGKREHLHVKGGSFFACFHLLGRLQHSACDAGLRMGRSSSSDVSCCR